MFRFGRSDSGREIGADIRQRMWPSLAIAMPSLIVGLLVHITLALLLVFFRLTYLEFWGVALCVVMMSISFLFYIIGGQYVLGKLLQLTPISGYDSGINAIRFLILPLVISVVAGIGSGVRWYRTLFLEEVEKDYIRTARAKGLSEPQVLFGHVLKNAMIPILTGVVVVLPLLFTGSLITESFFAIPGLGSYTIDASAAGFRHRACHGVLGLATLHPRPAADRSFLYAGRSPRASGCHVEAALGPIFCFRPAGGVSVVIVTPGGAEAFAAAWRKGKRGAVAPWCPGDLLLHLSLPYWIRSTLSADRRRKRYIKAK